MEDSTGYNINADSQDGDSVRRQVSLDLKKKLSEFNDAKKGIKAMSALMGVHEKTLRRLIDCENRPGYQTLLKIYRALYNTNSDTTVLSLMPQVLSDYVRKYKPKEEQSGVNVNLDVDHELQKNPVFSEIYCLASTGGISKEYISYHYGKYGETILERMVKLDVLVPIDKYKYILGTNQASITPETIKSLSLHLVERFFKTKSSYTPGVNYQYFYVSGLNEESYQKWLQVDEDAYYKKIEIAKDPKNHGDIKAFTCASIDTLDEENNKLLN